MATNYEEKYKAYDREVREKTDILSEFQLMGGRTVPGAAANASGWITVHAMGRTDDNPSAQINIGTGPSRGRYRDFGGEHDNLSFWDFCVKYGPFDNWKSARYILGDKAGVRRPRGEYVAPVEAFRFSPVAPFYGDLHMFCETRHTITPEAVLRTGARAAAYNCRLPLEMQQSVFVWNMYGPLLDEDDPIGYHAARVDGQKVRIHQKNRNEPTLSKTVSKGKVGWMNDWAIAHWREATRIILVEGLTDMIAGQMLAGDRTDILFMTLGSSSARPPAGSEFMFLNKTIDIVYDPDDPGRRGAIAVAAWFTLFGCNVRLVDLPNEGEDLRDWIRAGGTLEQLLELADGSRQITPESPEAQVTESSVYFEGLDAEVLGRANDGGPICVYSHYLKRMTTITNIDMFTWNQAAMAFGVPKLANKVVESRAQVTNPEQVTIKEFQKLIVEAANGKTVDTGKRFGQGVWRAAERDEFLLVNGRQMDVFSGASTELTPYIRGMWDNHLIDLGGDSSVWYDRTRVNEYLTKADDTEWTNELMLSLVGRIQNWYWKSTKHPTILAGLITGAIMQACWPIRPQVAVVGETSSGKSALIQRLIQPLFAPISTIQNRPTEAGIRQANGTCSKVVLIDEFDTSGNQDRILELFRNATFGGTIYKGSGNSQIARCFNINHMFFLFGIKVPFEEMPDRNRFCVLELSKLPPGATRFLSPPPVDEMTELREKLLAFCLLRYAAIIEMMHSISSVEFIEPRAVQMYSLPIAIVAVAFGWSVDVAKEFMQQVLAGQMEEFEELSFEVTEECQILSKIMYYSIRLPRGGSISVESWLSSDKVICDIDGTPVDPSLLEQYGVRRLRDGRIFLYPGIIKEKFFGGAQVGKYKKALGIKKALMLVKSAEVSVNKLGGIHRNGVAIDPDALLNAYHRRDILAAMDGEDAPGTHATTPPPIVDVDPEDDF